MTEPLCDFVFVCQQVADEMGPIDLHCCRLCGRPVLTRKIGPPAAHECSRTFGDFPNVRSRNIMQKVKVLERTMKSLIEGLDESLLEE